MTAPLRVAVIGSSEHAARVAAPTIAAGPDTELVAVLGSSPERARTLARRHPGCAVLPDIDALCTASGIDAVWIAGPNDTHVDHTARCPAAGRHVLVEKPLATTVREAGSLTDAAREATATLRVGFQHRFRPGHRWLRTALSEGRLGDVGLMRIHRFWPFPSFSDMPRDLDLGYITPESERDLGVVVADRWTVGGHPRFALDAARSEQERAERSRRAERERGATPAGAD